MDKISTSAVLMYLLIAVMGTSQFAHAVPAPYTGKPGIHAGQVCVNPMDGAEMSWIPAGQFVMGSADTDKNAHDDEKPQHKVYLDGYYIYKTKVTVAQYRKFCQATKREMPTAPSYWEWNDAYPMVYVSWDDANAYAAWAGASLQTEAQWEKAARGTDGRMFPWGNKWDYHKFNNTISVNHPGKTAPTEASLYGVLEMPGNVTEWCADRYVADYYQHAPAKNPLGPPVNPTQGTARVLRGGSWYSLDPANFRAACRNPYYPSTLDLNVGFRCVVCPPQVGQRRTSP